MNKRHACAIAASFSLVAGAGFAAMAPATITASNTHARYPAQTQAADGRQGPPLIRKLVKASPTAAPVAKPVH